MSKSTVFANDVLKLLFHGTGISNIADNAALGTLTYLFVSLHTADPSGGNQSTNEVDYDGYVRVPIVRSASGFTIVNDTLALVADVNFNTAGPSSAVATHAGIGTSIIGLGKLLMVGAIDPIIVVSSGVAPVLSTNSFLVEV